MAENPIRDTLFAGNPELYYTIGNASTMNLSNGIAAEWHPKRNNRCCEI